MRIENLLIETAVDELKNKLPKLHDHNYSTIDKLMKRISKDHHITGNKLHDLFVSKYGHTPDNWIKKYKNKLAESVNGPEDIEKIKDFIKWTIKRLNIQQPYPKFTLSRNTKEAQQGHHTGRHIESGDGESKQIWIYVENRNLIDIFRTIFHELVHERQSQLRQIGSEDSYPGSPIEAMADMLAGKYIKIYGEQHRDIFQ